MSYSISVIGSGSYGTALAISLARNGNKVLLWGRNQSKINRMQQTRSNEDFLPGILFPESLELTSDLEFAVKNTNILVVVIPSSNFRNVLQQIKPFLSPDHRLAWATKGIEAKTGKLLSDVVKEEFGNSIPFAVISGPTFAKELAAGMPTAISVSGSCDDFTDEFSRLIHSSKNFRVYKNPDYITDYERFGRNTETWQGYGGFAEYVHGNGRFGRSRSDMYRQPVEKQTFWYCFRTGKNC